MPILVKIRRRITYFKYNLRDFVDTYLAPALKERATPLGFHLVGSNSTHHKAMQDANFERIEVEWLNSEMNSFDVFVDIGANIGYFTCLARSHKKAVVAVEPLFSNLKFLLKNIDLNQGLPVEVYPVGLSNEVGIGSLYGLSSTGASLVSNWAGAPSTVAHLIPVTTLDNLISGRFLNEKLVIKIDVEGFEYQVLCGSLATISRNIKPTWLIEITHNQFHPDGVNPSFELTFQLFWNSGYKCYVLTKDTKEFIDQGDFESIILFEKQGYFNFIFTPT